MLRAFAGGLLGVVLCAALQAILFAGSSDAAAVSAIALIGPLLWTMVAVPLLYVPVLRLIERRRLGGQSWLLGASILALLVVSSIVGLLFMNLVFKGVPASGLALLHLVRSIEVRMLVPGAVVGAIGTAYALRTSARAAG